MKRFLYVILLYIFYCNFAFASQQTAETYFARAYANLYKDNTKEAEKIFLKAIEYYPDCAFLYNGLGDTYLKTKNIDLALYYYQKSISNKYSMDTYKVDYYNTKLIKTYEIIDEVTKKLISYTKISDNPIFFKNIQAILNENYSSTKLVTQMYLNTGISAIDNINFKKNNGNLEDAIKDYLFFLNSNPNNFMVTNNLAMTFFELKDYSMAEKYIEIALKNNPNSVLILSNKAIIKFHLKKYNEMDEIYKIAFKIKQDNPILLNNFAISKMQKELSFYSYDIINTLLDIIKKDNKNVYAIRTLAKIYFIKGDFKNADITLDLINSENITSPQLLTQKAYFKHKNNQNLKAKYLINESINADSDKFINYLIKARICTEIEEYEIAKQNFNTLKQNNKNFQNILFHQAILENKIGKTNKANELMKEFLKVNSGDYSTNYLYLLFK